MAATENLDETPEVASLESSWVFIDKPATVDEVKALLATVEVPFTTGNHGPSENPAAFGPILDPITMEQYLPYILPMSNNSKVKIQDPQRPDRTIDSWVTQTTLYTQVAGRLRILADVAARNGWAVTIRPEPITPTGIPGYLRFDDRLVFRVYVDIKDKHGDSLGSRFGTAWVLHEGGSNAAGTNPYETVETSALGRALAQWGFGVLPGSGIASVEEMRLAKSNQGSPHGAGKGGKEPREKEERGDLIASAIDFMERRRKMSGITQEEVDAGLAKWAARRRAS